MSQASFPSPARIAALSTEYAVAITNDEHLAVQAHGQSTTLICLPSAMYCPSFSRFCHPQVSCGLKLKLTRHACVSPNNVCVILLETLLTSLILRAHAQEESLSNQRAVRQLLVCLQVEKIRPVKLCLRRSVRKQHLAELDDLLRQAESVCLAMRSSGWWIWTPQTYQCSPSQARL